MNGVGWMAATESDAEIYAEICRVAVTHMPPGRDANEAEITETVLGTLGRMGYEASKHPIWGFGAAGSLLPEVPLGLVVTLVQKVTGLISGLVERKREREIRARLPTCVVQLVVIANGGTRYGKPSNLVAELVVILPAILADLEAADYRRRFLFMIYASAPEYLQVSMNLSDDDLGSKDLVKVLRACEAKPEVEKELPGVTLNLWFVKKHWWTPKKVERLLNPGFPGTNVVDSARGQSDH